MANGLSLPVGPLMGAQPNPLAGFSAGLTPGIQGINQTLQALIQQRFQQEALEQQFQRRQQLVSEQQAFQSGLAGEQRQLQRDLADQQDRRLRELEASRQKFQKALLAQKDAKDPFDKLFKGVGLLQAYDLDPKDPENMRINRERDLKGFENILLQQAFVKSDLVSVLGDRERERKFFGDSLTGKQRRQLTALAKDAMEAPATFLPKLQQHIATIRQQISERLSQPTLLGRLLFGGDAFAGQPQGPQRPDVPAGVPLLGGR